MSPSLYLDFAIDQTLNSLNNPLVTTKLLGKAKIPDQSFENPDGSTLQIATDYFGKERSTTKPSAGPFEDPGSGKFKLEVW